MSGANSGIYQARSQLTSNGRVPPKSEVYSVVIALVAGTALTYDLRPLANLHRIDNVQGIYIDNSANATAFTVTTDTLQMFSVGANCQGVMPLYRSGGQVLTLTGNGSVTITLLNFPTAAAVWNAAGANVVTISGTAQVQDALAESYLLQMVPGFTATSFFSASTAVAASTVLMAANNNRTYLRIGCGYLVASKTFFDIWINDNGGTAGPGLQDSFRIPAGTFYESNEKVSKAAINYYDAVGGNTLAAIQG